MYMFKARIAAEQELERALAECGVTSDEVRAFLEKNPKYDSPLHHSPHTRRGLGGEPRLRGGAAHQASRRRSAPWTRPSTRRETAHEGREERAPGDRRGVQDGDGSRDDRAASARTRRCSRDIVRGKAMDRFRPLLERLMGKAIFENNPEIPSYAHSDEPIAAEE